MIIILLNIAGFSQTNHKNRRPLDNPNKITQNSARAPSTCEKSGKISQKIQFEYENTF